MLTYKVLNAQKTSVSDANSYYTHRAVVVKTAAGYAVTLTVKATKGLVKFTPTKISAGKIVARTHHVTGGKDVWTYRFVVKKATALDHAVYGRIRLSVPLVEIKNQTYGIWFVFAKNNYQTAKAATKVLLTHHSSASGTAATTTRTAKTTATSPTTAATVPTKHATTTTGTTPATASATQAPTATTGAATSTTTATSTSSPRKQRGALTAAQAQQRLAHYRVTPTKTHLLQAQVATYPMAQTVYACLASILTISAATAGWYYWWQRRHEKIGKHSN